MHPFPEPTVNYSIFICDQVKFAENPATNDVEEFTVAVRQGASAYDVYWWIVRDPGMAQKWRLWDQNWVIGIVDTSTGELLWTASQPETTGV